MPLRIETFSNVTGGSSFFKAVGHPLAAPKAAILTARLASYGPVAFYDPLGLLSGLTEFYDLSAVPVAGVYVQNVELVGTEVFGHAARPVTELAQSEARTVFVVAFDSQRLEGHIAHLIPKGAGVVSLDAMRVPEDMLTDSGHYLSKFNWATNFAWLRDEGGHHTRIVSSNYWPRYGAKGTRLWACLFDADGKPLAEWTEPMPPADGTVVIDSRQVRARFGLGDFCGTLFLHVIGAAGHDVVKYALDTYGDDDTVLSCTHDANAWPADRYAGLPAPREDERVLLWVQNSHPTPVPAGAVGLNLMGRDEVRTLDRALPPFSTVALDTRDLFPEARWPQQFEVQAGKHFVRPRYEIVAGNGRRRIAHANVERADLKPDPRLAALTGGPLGKGHILPAPLLPPGRWRTTLLPTPMSTAQTELPVQAVVYDARGREVARHRFGSLKRSDSVALDVSGLAAQGGLQDGFGHVELLYDFEAGTVADGWLHALVRYEDVTSGHVAETSFGSHIFNTAMIYRDEPQSYHGRPPGLSTRLFLRMGPAQWDTICHLIYPASTPWHAGSDTSLVLVRRDGIEVARKKVSIACSGSLFWRVSDLFSEAERMAAGEQAYVLVRDTTCRLFGYHGCATGDSAFSLDHMFGF
ncbi:hypothetical protein [Azospirillum thermophilum]|uniref:Uncharacterized protein n=1 Tax=Azospirillum thermophilum TaxID=2202148 RepID=A0A2S2CT31_9PROT|nr:hypothetical protein [Azospirillum thermophilum]AWK87575.1 hypothetical protein DEW08_16310 [Azospirillum thermophilum]